MKLGFYIYVCTVLQFYHDQSILTITSHHENVNTIQCNGKKNAYRKDKRIFFFLVAHPRPQKIEIERLKTLKVKD